MALAIVGSATNITFDNGTPSATYTPGGGASHVVAMVTYSRYDGNPISALSVGGNGFTKLCDVIDETYNYCHSEIWWRAGFSGSGLTVAITADSTWKDFGVTFICVSGAATPTVYSTDHHDAGTAVSTSVACAVGDLIVVSVGSTRSGFAGDGWTNSFTGDLDEASANSISRFLSAHKIATGTSESTSTTVAGGLDTHGATIAMAVIPAAAGSSASNYYYRQNQ